MQDDQVRVDTTTRIVTPENIAFEHRLAGPFRRLPAYLIDLVIRIGVVMAVGISTTFALAWVGLEGFGVGATLVLWFLLDWFYGGLFEALWNGQTPGKRMLNLRVVTIEGTPINGWQAILRNFLRYADAMPFVAVAPTYVLGFSSVLLTRRNQRLGDLAAGTMVILEQRERQAGVVRIDEPEALQLAAQLPAELRLSRSMGRALAAYVQRRKLFTAARRLEMARHVAVPLAERWRLPAETNPDLLLCAAYYRAFIDDRPFDDDRAAAGRGRTAQYVGPTHV